MPAYSLPTPPPLTSSKVSATSYGASATSGSSGGAQNSMAIQAAVDDLLTIGGGTVILPACRGDGSYGYYLRYPVWLNGSRVSIRGEGDQATFVKSHGPAFVVGKHPRFWEVNSTFSDVDAGGATVNTKTGSDWNVYDTTASKSYYRTDLYEFRSGSMNGYVPLDYEGYYTGQRFAVRTRKGTASGRWPDHNLATGNTQPSSDTQNGWEDHTCAAFDFIIYHHEASLVGGIAGMGTRYKPDPWHLSGESGYYYFAFAATDVTGIDNTLVFARIDQPSTHQVGLHRITFQVDFVNQRVLAWLDRVQVAVTLQYPNPNAYHPENGEMWTKWNRFARWKACDFAVGSESEMAGRANETVYGTPSDYSIIGVAAYPVELYKFRSNGDAQLFRGGDYAWAVADAAAIDATALGSNYNTSTYAIGCINNEIVNGSTDISPPTDTNLNITLGGHGRGTGAIWGYLCPISNSGNDGNGGASAVAYTSISNLNIARSDGTMSSCGILIGAHLYTGFRNLKITTGFNCSIGSIPTFVSYNAFYERCEFGSVRFYNQAIYMKHMRFQYPTRYSVRMSGSGIKIEDALIPPSGVYTEGFLLDFAGDNLNAGITLLDLSWDNEDVRINPNLFWLYTEKRYAHSGHIIEIDGVTFGETPTVPTLYLNDLIEANTYKAMVRVRDSLIPTQSPVIYVRGSDWHGDIEISRQGQFDDTVTKLPTLVASADQTINVSTVGHDEWGLPPCGGFTADCHKVRPKHAPRGGVSEWNVLTSGIEGTSTPPVWQPISFVPARRKHAISANINAGLYVTASIPYPVASTTTLYLSSATDFWANALLDHMLTGAAAKGRAYMKLQWGLYLPYNFGNDNPYSDSHATLFAEVANNSTYWNTAATSSSKSTTASITLGGQTVTAWPLRIKKRAGFAMQFGATGATTTLLAGKTIRVPKAFFEVTGATSVTLASGDLTIACNAHEGCLTHYAANKLLDHIAGAGSLGWPSTVYFGLSSTEPTLAGGSITEPSGGSYARVSKALNSTNFGRWGKYGYLWSNKVDIEWPTPSGAWGDCYWVFVSDASSGGNIIAKAPLNRPISVASSDTAPIFYPGALQWQL